MEQTVKSSNLFIDSSRSHTNGSKGDDFQIHLQDSGITAESGEIIRLTLDNFSMSKNFTDINANNSEMRIVAATQSASTGTLISVLTGGVNIGTDTLTSVAAHNLNVGDILRYHANGTAIGGLLDQEIVHVRATGLTAAAFTISAISGDGTQAVINLTGTGDNAQTFELLQTPPGPLAASFFNLTHQDIEKGDFFALASDFGTQLAEALRNLPHAAIGSFSVGSVTPLQTQQHTGNRILQFTLTHHSTNPPPPNPATLITDHHLTDLRIQCLESRGDSYAIIGGDRVLDNNDLTSNSVGIAITANTITVTCRYPAQRSTMPYIYIRTPGLVSKNIETQGLQDPDKNAHKGDTVHSDILGRAVVDQEWVQYTAGTGREFFLDINQRHLTHLQFRLTDSRNRPIGRKLTHNVSQTAFGSGSQQSTLGNLEFSACVRIDIIRKRQANEFATSKHQPSVPARFSGGILNQFPNEHI